MTLSGLCTGGHGPRRPKPIMPRLGDGIGLVDVELHIRMDPILRALDEDRGRPSRMLVRRLTLRDLFSPLSSSSQRRDFESWFENRIAIRVDVLKQPPLTISAATQEQRDQSFSDQALHLVCSPRSVSRFTSMPMRLRQNVSPIFGI